MSRRTTLGWVWASSLTLTLLGAVAFPSLVAAATKAERTNSAQQLVSEALHREIYGRSADRQKLLDQALEQVPEFAPAMWHRGFVRYQNKWLKAEELPQLLDREQRMEAYETIRDKYPNTVAGQFALAQWCEKRGLADQARAHLTAVLTLDPEHSEARARLGFRQVDGQWLTASEIEKNAAQAAAESAALATWRPKLENLLNGLKRDGKLSRETAAARLREIRDVSAIPALEVLLSRESEKTAGLVVEALAAMPESAASLALARQAIFSPWKSVRDAAAEQLRSRQQDNYVPALLSSLSGPIVSNTALFRTPGGRLMYRHTFSREGQDQRDVLVLDTSFQRVALPGGDNRDSTARAVGGAQSSAVSRELTVVQRNALQSELNLRICSALRIATQEKLPDSPEAWWQWWNQYNEVFIAGEKQVKSRYLSQEVAIVDRTPDLSGGSGATGGSGQGSSGPPRLSCDCLAAGTLVWTASGERAIEKVRVGDLVLSQSAETGELAYKPVLRTTLRPRGKLVKIQTGDETIQTSGGHLFWVSGEGWVKSRNIRSGMELHGMHGTLCVSTVEPGSEQETYNLIVADFNTYFVGKSRVLSHDNTVRQPSDAVVPGLLER